MAFAKHIRALHYDRYPSYRLNKMTCAQCGETMTQTEKDTSSGRDIREYKCPHCGHSDWEVRGPALWQILHDDREECEASKTTLTPTSTPDSQTEAPRPKHLSASSLWGRFRALFTGSRYRQ